MTWILIIITSVTMVTAAFPSLEECRAAFKEEKERPIYPGKVEHSYCIAASGKDVHWKSADPTSIPE